MYAAKSPLVTFPTFNCHFPRCLKFNHQNFVVKILGNVERTIFPRAGRNCVSMDGALYELSDYAPEPENQANRFRLALTEKGCYSVTYHEPSEKIESRDEGELTSHAVEKVGSKFNRLQASLVSIAKKFNVPVEEMNPLLNDLQSLLDDAVDGLHAGHQRRLTSVPPPVASSSASAAASSSSTDAHKKAEEAPKQSAISNWVKHGYVVESPTAPLLHSAAFYGDEEAVKALLSSDQLLKLGYRKFRIPCFPITETHVTVVHCAAAGSNPRILEMLLASDRTGVNNTTFKAKFPVVFAAAYGGAEMLTIALKHGAPLHLKAIEGLSLVHCAAMGGHVAVFDVLKKKSASMTLLDYSGLAAIHLAAMYGNDDLIRWMRANEVDMKLVGTNKISLVHAAAMAPTTAILAILAKGKTKTDFKVLDAHGASAAHYAAASGKVHNLEWLSSNTNIDMNAPSKHGITPAQLINSPVILALHPSLDASLNWFKSKGLIKPESTYGQAESLSPDLIKWFASLRARAIDLE